MQDKVLIIAANMLPYSESWGNSQRMYFLADYLCKNNIRVFSICLPDSLYNDFGKEIRYHIQPLHIKSKNNNIEPSHQLKYERIKSSQQKLLLYVKKVFLKIANYFLNEPSKHKGIKGLLWVFFNKKNIFDIISKNNISKVLISVPPFSVLHILRVIKQKYPNVKTIIDYRDPWNLWNNNKGIPFQFEKRILKKADRIVTFSETYDDDLISEFSIPRSKTSLIYNGYSEASWKDISSDRKNNNKLLLSHIGSINLQNKKGYRNLDQLLEAIAESDLKDEIILQFVGINQNNDTNILLTKYPFLEFIDKVPYNKSLEYMVQSDVLLLLHTATDASAKYIISAKLFDYMRSNRTVLGIGDSNSLHKNLIMRYKLGLYSANNSIEIRRSLKELLEMWKTGKLNHQRANKDLSIEEFSREYQNEKYLQLIQSM